MFKVIFFNLTWKSYGLCIVAFRIQRALDKFYELYKPDSNSATKGLPDHKIEPETKMPLLPRNPEATQLSEAIRDTILYGAPKEKVQYYNVIAQRKKPELESILRSFNRSQQLAIERSESNFVTLIQVCSKENVLSYDRKVGYVISQVYCNCFKGPPGTGKTSTATGIIRRAWRASQKILVTAPSNTAVDNLLRALLNSAESPKEYDELRKSIVRVCSRGQFYTPPSDIQQFTIFKYSTNPERWDDTDVYW